MKKYKQQILYLLFGGFTTLVNIAAYYFLYNYLRCSNVLSVAIAWVISVLFAFVTNRKYVFESENNSAKNILRETAAFFICRALTGVMDVAVMWLAVDIMVWNSTLWKIISNILVIALNYFASKLLIFKKGNK